MYLQGSYILQVTYVLNAIIHWLYWWQQGYFLRVIHMGELLLSCHVGWFQMMSKDWQAVLYEEKGSCQSASLSLWGIMCLYVTLLYPHNVDYVLWGPLDWLSTGLDWLRCPEGGTDMPGLERRTLAELTGIIVYIEEGPVIVSVKSLVISLALILCEHLASWTSLSSSGSVLQDCECSINTKNIHNWSLQYCMWAFKTGNRGSFKNTEFVSNKWTTENEGDF